MYHVTQQLIPRHGVPLQAHPTRLQFHLPYQVGIFAASLSAYTLCNASQIITNGLRKLWIALAATTSMPKTSNKATELLPYTKSPLYNFVQIEVESLPKISKPSSTTIELNSKLLKMIFLCWIFCTRPYILTCVRNSCPLGITQYTAMK